MLSKKNYDKYYIKEQIKKYPRVDSSKMEMTIFAFGLLDELVRCGVYLIFKGGTSLLLLLDSPQRISTDIDIIVPINLNFDKVFEKVKKEFPFYDGEERGISQNKYFRHFYFMFKGPVTNKECRINLDVAFENNPYEKTIQKELHLDFLLTQGEKTYVTIPTHESIMGDKLTAFAPTTIGVNPFKTSLGKDIDNRLQVMKQFYDVARLFDYVEDIDAVLKTYEKCHRFENVFRGTEYTLEETLMDTFNHAAMVASMGAWDKKSNFYSQVVKAGVLGLASNIFSGKYNLVEAANDAAKVMHIVASLLSKLTGTSVHIDNKKLKCFKTIIDKKTFNLIKECILILSK